MADCKRRLIDICVGMLGNVNDSRVLHRFLLYKQVQLHGLFDIIRGSCKDIIPPYLLGDKGYPLIIWIMMPFKKDGQHNILELLYNIKHKKADLWLRMHLAF
jgi:hypothetical protein